MCLHKTKQLTAKWEIGPGILVYSNLLLLTSLQVYSTSDSLQQVVVTYKFTSLQVYSTSDSLQQIVAIYKSLTNQWAFTLLQSFIQDINKGGVTEGREVQTTRGMPSRKYKFTFS